MKTSSRYKIKQAYWPLFEINLAFNTSLKILKVHDKILDSVGRPLIPPDIENEVKSISESLQQAANPGIPRQDKKKNP